MSDQTEADVIDLFTRREFGDEPDTFSVHVDHLERDDEREDDDADH